MYISYDDGNTWKPFQLNLPKVPITDMIIKENDLVVATQGRALYVLDDLAPVQQLNATITQKKIFAFDISPAYRYNGSQNLKAVNAGINPINGVVVNYFLKDVNDSSKVVITVKDENKNKWRKNTGLRKAGKIGG
jgi:hypothetical protein